VVALPKGHPLARRKKIDPAALKDEAFVNTGPELDVGFFGHTEVVARAGNFTPRVVKRDDDFLTVLTYVSIGYGIAIVPNAMCLVKFPNIVFRELAVDPVPTSSVTFAYRRNDTSRSANLLTQHMRRYALAR